MNNLTKCGVVFDKERHTYELNGKKLGGVTAIVKWMYPETYKDIPQKVLEKAAAYGSLIHSMCEMADNIGIAESATVKDYLAIKDKLGLCTVANEYLVTDGKDIASSIDVVLRDIDDNEPMVFPLADIKTTSMVHKENVRLQLSIYAYLFEQNNPGKTAGKLYVFWLPKPNYGEAEAIELERIPSDLCGKIIAAYVNGESNTPFIEMIANSLKTPYEDETTKDGAEGDGESELPEELTADEARLMELQDSIKKMQDEEKELRTRLLDRMTADGMRVYHGRCFTLTRKSESTRESVDSTKLKKLYANIYEECKKVTKVAPSLMIKTVKQ